MRLALLPWVELVGSGRSPEELAREFEPSAQSIRNWVCRTDLDEKRRSDGLTSDEKEELPGAGGRCGRRFLDVCPFLRTMTRYLRS